MEATELLLHIAAGEYDEYLDRIITGAANRRKLVRDGEAAERLAVLEKGDVVEFTNDCTPAYIRGARAVVRGFDGEKVIIRMLESRYRGNKSIQWGARLTAPATILKTTGQTSSQFEDRNE